MPTSNLLKMIYLPKSQENDKNECDKCKEIVIKHTMPELKITHVIFDLDGLLLDTEKVYTAMFNELLSKFGKQYTMELKAMSMGKRMEEAIPLTLKYYGIEDKVTPEEFWKDSDVLEEKYMKECDALPGAYRLVQHLSSHGIPLAICSGSTSFQFSCKVEKHSALLDLIPLRVLTGDDPDVRNGKPAPDGYLVCMSRFKEKPSSPSNVLVFEDSPNGVRAAVAAGMSVVMVPDLRFSPVPEECKDKILSVLGSLEEFVPESVGLPAYD